MRPVGVIAWNVYRESVRDKVPYTLVVFTVLLMLASLLIGQLSAGQDVRIIKDLGLAASSLIGLFIAIFLGIGLVSKEVEKRSIFVILSKPVARHQFILGKYLGLLLTLAVNLSVMAAAHYLVLAWTAWGVPAAVQAAWERPALDAGLLAAYALTFCELAVVTALALAFATLSSPLLASAFTVATVVAGRLSADLRSIGDVVESPMAQHLARALYAVLPHLDAFDVRAQVVHGPPVTAAVVLWSGALAACYVVAALAVALLVFSRRDFR